MTSVEDFEKYWTPQIQHIKEYSLWGNEWYIKIEDIIREMELTNIQPHEILHNSLGILNRHGFDVTISNRNSDFLFIKRRIDLSAEQRNQLKRPLKIEKAERDDKNSIWLYTEKDVEMMHKKAEDDRSYGKKS
ncbi:Uncharacterised protein [uncultured archaeon]|nr:Uncharacterised protein [uncultured archaeon]